MNHSGKTFILGQTYLFNPVNHSLVDQTNNDKEVKLGNNENRILQLLIARPNEIISRSEFHDFVWREQGIEVEDSSLTQAISTLRKQLKDPTKTPLFVKTVPRRGYKLIASIHPSETDEFVEETASCQAAPIPLSTTVPDWCDSVAENHNRASNNAMKSEPVGDIVPALKPLSSLRAMWAVIVATLLLPILAYAYADSPAHSFQSLGQIDSIDIVTSTPHATLSQWHSTIERCVTNYTQGVPQDQRPTEVIVTGGKNAQLALNFIHSVDQSSQNTTMHLFSTTSGLLNNICVRDV